MSTTNRKQMHPEIKDVQTRWKRIDILLNEKEDKYGEPDFFLSMPNEQAAAKTERAISFCRGFINITGVLLRSKTDSVYRKGVNRVDLTSMQTEFTKNADRSFQSFEEVMRNEVALGLSGFGTVFAVIDKPKGESLNAADEEKKGVPYITILSPFQVLDFEWGDDGELLWFKYLVDSEAIRTDPNVSRNVKLDRTVTWTRTEYITQTGKEKSVSAPNPFKFVPVVIQTQYCEPNKTIGKSSFFATSNMIIMANNLACASNFEVFKNAAATLLMNIQDWHEESIEREKNPDTNLKRLTVQSDEQKNVLLYQTDKPEYLARDLKLVDSAAARAITYFEKAVDNERTAFSVLSASSKVTGTPASGASKAYDFVDVNNVLASFASALEKFEHQVYRFVARMTNQNDSLFTVIYPRVFDVRTLAEKVTFVEGLISIGMEKISPTLMREAYKGIAPDVTQDPEKQDAGVKEIDAASFDNLNIQPVQVVNPIALDSQTDPLTGQKPQPKKPKQGAKQNGND